MTQPVRIGVIGCGSVSEKYLKLANQMRLRGQAETVAACDIKDARGEWVRAEYGVGRFTTRYQDLLAMPDVDLVLVLTSMQMHGEITRAALQAGKHVLVEKPMSTSLDEAAEIVELARTSPGHLVPAPHVVLSKTYQNIWQRVHRGDIGQVTLARALYGWAGPWWGRWFYQPGGGALFDLGVYNVTTLTGLLGPAKRVTGMVGVAVPERMAEGSLMKLEAEDNAHVLIDFGNSVFAVVSTGFTIQRYRCPAVELYGTTGTLQMMGDDWDPEGYELWQNEKGAWQIFDEPEPDWPWYDGVRHLVDCIHTGAKPLVTPEHAFHVLEIMLKAQEAGRDGRARDINSTFTPQSFGEPAVAAPAPHLVHDPTS
ncbi:MAG: Gfo/Idh/MocA family oxidoreductase [Anaerolineales bacterium]